MRSLAAAYEEAMKKKSTKGAGLVHPSFPGQGAIQPSHMGSQSAAPMQNDAMDPANEMGAPPVPGMY